MLHLHLSNRPDTLVMAQAALMRAAPLPLLETEQVVTPATAVSRWLGFRLADELGIATQIAFPFPAAYVWHLFGRVLAEVAAVNPFDRAAMQWRLLRLLGESAAPEVRRYLADDDGVKRYELACRLAAQFDRYLVERPDWLEFWGAGKLLGLGPDEIWQAGLWRALMGELSEVAAEHPRQRFMAQLRRDPRARARLPQRISLFAVESMPALYWEVFLDLAEWIDLHVFVLAPCREYWGDIDRERVRLRLAIDHPEAARLLEAGHPLLASLGRARQHAMTRLTDAGERLPTREHHYFVDPPTRLLGRLQRDILDLDSSTTVAPDDSLQIHACHGPLREAEVLHDRLLALFEAMPDLHPADILILTPDIETYAPAIEAVLQHAPAARRIPCVVADRPLVGAPLWRALRRLCAVAESELDAESVMGLLEEPAVRRAFDLAESELPLLRDWVATAGIRWGLDGRARQRRGLPLDDAHTWRAGLQRLLLGVAMPDVPERLYGGVLPVTGIEGGRAELLGRFADYAEALFVLVQKVGAGHSQADARPPVTASGDFMGGSEPGLRAWGANKVGAGGTASNWMEILGEAQERFLASTEGEEDEAQRIRAALAELAAHARTARCEARLPLAVMLRELDVALAERAPARAFASGAATIAALLPGRPLPARVLCLVGMNDGAWPRPATPVSFDLIARHPRPGDRNHRGEERYAFLEMLLCAGDALVVTYTGRDPRSNVEFPPAAPLAEVIDTLATMTGLSATALVVQHPLQPFSAAYFDQSAPLLFSFDAEQCGAICAAGATHAERSARPFLGGMPVHVPAAGELIELPRLQHFFDHPVRFYLREQLGIHLEESEELLEIHEPFVTDNLDNYRLREAHFAGLKASATAEETTQLLRARGWLPHGVAGGIASAAAHEEAGTLWQSAHAWATAEALPPVELRFDSGQTVLSGRLDHLTPNGLWRLRFGSTRPQDRLRLWIDHLLLQLAAPPGVVKQSVLLANDGVTVLAPLEDFAPHLTELLALYRQGQSAPMPFYPRTAWAWLEGKSGWRSAWFGNSFQKTPGERDDAYLRLALRDRMDDPLGATFQQLAAQIFGPLRAAMQAVDASTEKPGDD
ncbi:MAG: exodeoxyribonuclease V subunit gamma [Rhodocyclaceae bacterium]|nr:exodeoxyribonuclease V subunit gamma [Rhodocyclaceae bacterium]